MRHRLRIVFFCLPVLLGGLSNSAARTWYVAADGSGDAPSIDAAVDSSNTGDVILVGPGTYLIGSSGLGALYLKPGTTLQSESGPAFTVLFPYDGPAQPSMVQMFDGCAIMGFHVTRATSNTVAAFGNDIEIGGNIIEASGQTVTVDGVATVHHNVIYGAIAVIWSDVFTSIHHNIVLGRISQCAGTVLVYCNDVTVPSSCVSYGQSNFNLDPMFCGVDNYYLHAASPCAPGNHPNGYNDCGLIGPLPVGCGTVSVQETTWGAVKALYRD